MNRIAKRVVLGIAIVLGTAIVGGGAFAYSQASAFDASLDKVYSVSVPTVARSSDSAVIARGKHVANAITGCTSTACHGSDLGGGKPLDVGPLGMLTAPNISMGGLGAAYSDGELVRLIQHGIKKDGRTVRFMPCEDFGWLPAADAAAVAAYVHSAPAVDRPNGGVRIGLLGKILDRRGLIFMDVARRIESHPFPKPVPVAPNAEYGHLLGLMCTGCHGETLSGGKIPGTPPSIPIPLNITPDATGLKDWTYDDFARLLDTGMRKNEKKLDPFMPLEAFSKMDDVERHALWAYLQTLPPTAFGNR